MPYNFTAIEKKWQQRWLDEHAFRALDPAEAPPGMPKRYVLDMFPYPSGAGLHVGHVENYTATDILARYHRMRGFNVLHPTGWDAFGLPAEQYAINTNRHPREMLSGNIANFRRQIQSLGFSYDWERELDTTDPAYYRWTQWIFLQLFNSYFDPIDRKASPIAHLINELENENLVVAPDGSVRVNPTPEGMERVTGEVRIERLWRELDLAEQAAVIDGQRLAYMDEAPVNWCPALGTVLANEEVIDGKSERGGFPVERRPMRQWLLRITAYADRLIDDLALLQWPEPMKEMQRNWIGKSVGAEVDFEIDPASLPERVMRDIADENARRSAAVGRAMANADEAAANASDEDLTITVFTTRPDTLFGATYLVLAPEHPLVDRITSPTHHESIEAYRQVAAARSDRDRMADAKEKTGVFTGAFAINPVNGERIPVYVADYVLMGYGTGAIMAVPAHDERDFEFSRKFKLPGRRVVADRKAPQSAEAEPAAAFTGEGIAINSPWIDGLPTAQAKREIIEELERRGVGVGSVKYKLRDWLFSRQRYWGEPFPILLDADGRAHSLEEAELPLMLPEVADFKPTGTPDPPLSKAAQWVRVRRDGTDLVRETNTMPQWAGSSWYYLRFCDPANPTRLVDPDKERYWMPVDVYVGGVEHAVLHLLYARFWHKVLSDLGHVSTPEPFMRLVNQGIITGEMEFHVFESVDGRPVSLSELRDVGEESTEAGVFMRATHRESGAVLRGRRVGEEQVEKAGEGFRLKSNPDIRVDARSFKMSKSRGNVANPDDLVRDYGADALRLYVMYLGPLEAPKPWGTRDIVGMTRFLNAAWRHIAGDEENAQPAKVGQGVLSDDLERQLHRTIKKVGEDTEAMRYNTAIAELIKLNNEMGRLQIIPRELAESFTLMLAPFAPHTAEELWERLGHRESLARHPWPAYDPKKLDELTMELPVQVNGKLRARVTVSADADEEAVLAAAAAAPDLAPWVEGKTVRKRLYVPKKLVNFVVG